MNRLCRYIEDIDFDIKRKVRNSEDFDYHTLMDNNILFKQTIYYQVYKYNIFKILNYAKSFRLIAKK